MAGDLHRERAAAVPAGRDRGGAGRQAGEGQTAAASRGAEHGAAGRGPDRPLLDPDRLPPDKRWSRKHAHTQQRLCERFAAPRHRDRDLPGHHHLAHPADHQRRANRGRRQAGGRDDLSPGHGRHRRRVPGQPAAGQGALAGRRPQAARCPRPGSASLASRRCGSTPPRSPPPATSPGSAWPWPAGGTATATS
jgi:hypothetical protein